MASATTVGTAKRHKKNLLKNQISQPVNVILHIIFIIGVVFCVYPVLIIIGSSLTDELTLAQFGYNIIPRVFTTNAYKYVAATGLTVVRAYGVTIFATVFGTLFSVAFTSMFSYPLARTEFPWRRHFSLFIYITMVFGGGLIPYFIVITRFLHLGNTLFVLFVPAMFGGYNAFVLRTFINRNIPSELIESARIDGSTEFNTYTKIVVPLSKAGLATIAFFTALYFWNDWYTCLLFNGSKPHLYDLGYLLYQILMTVQYLSSIATNAGLQKMNLPPSMGIIPKTSMQMAMCVMALGPIIIVYPFFQRFFIKGLVIGAVKG